MKGSKGTIIVFIVGVAVGILLVKYAFPMLGLSI